MKPETERYLDKARQVLSEARAVAGIGLAEVAREALNSVFHTMIIRRFAFGPRVKEDASTWFSPFLDRHIARPAAE